MPASPHPEPARLPGVSAFFSALLATAILAVALPAGAMPMLTERWRIESSGEQSFEFSTYDGGDINATHVALAGSVLSAFTVETRSLLTGGLSWSFTLPVSSAGADEAYEAVFDPSGNVLAAGLYNSEFVVYKLAAA